MKNTDEVAVFWDYGNCPAPTDTSGYAIVNNIRSVAQSFGSVKLFKAYLEVTEQVRVSRAVVLRSELQSSGVSLTDCPHNGRKDIADRMIIVDMLAHAIDNPAPSTIVLISGDRDFAYALSILKLRRYHIVLITPPNAHQSLRAQASHCFDWVSDVLELIDPTLPTSPCCNKTSAPLVHDKFYLDPKGHSASRAPFQESYNEKSTSNVEFMDQKTRRSKDSQASLRHDFLPLDLEQSKRQLAASRVASDALRNGPESFPRAIHSPFCHTNINGSIDTPLTPMTAPTSTTHESIMASRTSAHSAIPEFPNLAHHEATSAITPMPVEFTTQLLRADHDLQQFSPSFQQSTHPPINVKPQSLSGNGQMAGDATSFAVIPSPVQANPPGPAFFPAVPDKFKVLIQCLKSYRSKGNLRPLRSLIGLEIAQNGTTYRQAGVLKFSQYVAMAEQAGIIQLGGCDGTSWVALRAPWCYI